MQYDNVVLIGFMGSGKTSIGRILARKLYKEFKDVDTLIEKEQGTSITEIFNAHGEEHFRALEQACYHKLIKGKGQIIATGGGLPIHTDLGEKSLLINIDADFDVILARLSDKERNKRPLLQDEESARALYDKRINTYRELAHFSVDANQNIPVFIHLIYDFLLDKRVH